MSVIRGIVWTAATAFLVGLATIMWVYGAGRLATWIVTGMAVGYVLIGVEWGYKRASAAGESK